MQQINTKKSRLRRWGIFALFLIVLLALGWYFMIRMPGKSYTGPLPPLTEQETALAGELREIVTILAGEIGERNVPHHHAALEQSARFIQARLVDMGYEVDRQVFQVSGKDCENLAAEIPGGALADEIVVAGAHYDSVFGAPGANDNGSAVAACLALARVFRDMKPARTLRFVFFVNEEPPYFQTGAMGSLVYARGCKDRKENVVAMYSLETMGYYSDEKGSQKYPPPLGFVYPSTGNFIAFVGNMGSGDLVRSSIGIFRKHVQFPSEGGALPGFIPGVGWSDHWAFWKAGYQAVMITDTAPFRYPHYHLATDTPDKVDYERLARVTTGIEKVIAEVSNP
jgi:Zn-dependent M28 family amino/carboxypeptidase